MSSDAKEQTYARLAELELEQEAAQLRAGFLFPAQGYNAARV